MRPVEAFDYDLPEERIARRPASPRDASRLLVASRRDGRILAEGRFRSITDHLRPGDLLVVNDSKVVPARIHGVKEETGARLEVFFLDLAAGVAFVRPAKRVRPGTRILLDGGGRATVAEALADGMFRIEPDLGGEASPLGDLSAYLERHGEIPLPPYIAKARPAEAADRRDYQTVYAGPPGSVAAPTAGLHFTNDLLDDINKKGAEVARITLHVGPGTFRPVGEGGFAAHRMHFESFSIDAGNAGRIEAARREGRRVIAVGTTAVRTLEHLFRERGRIEAAAGQTDLFISEGFPFGVVGALVTNFHLPRSTLLVLVSAFAGYEATMNLYRHAVANDYRFYSYGDACLIL